MTNLLLPKDRPLIMGVINITPDSYVKNSRVKDVETALKKTSEMVAQGADLIDLGAMSSRPGAEIIKPLEELNRLKASFLAIRKEFPKLFISVDTLSALVAEFALDHGANMINDISAFELDSKLLEVIAKHDSYYCLMHMQKDPTTMQAAPNYANVSLEVLHFLKKKLSDLSAKQVSKVIIDPGFGFGKSIDHNYKLLADLEVFKILDKPVLVGLSRKSMIYRHLGLSPAESLPPTAALQLYALQKGANILRVHDVATAKHCIALHQKLKESSN